LLKHAWAIQHALLTRAVSGDELELLVISVKLCKGHAFFFMQSVLRQSTMLRSLSTELEFAELASSGIISANFISVVIESFVLWATEA
jgi:hypothetical protein